MRMIALTCSAGGHLSEMRQLDFFYAQHKHFFITFKRPDTESLAKKERVFFIERPARNIVKTLQAFVTAWKILSRERPRLIISTGADVTVPVCVAGKLLGIRILFIESFCRPETPGWTGRILGWFADYVVYQWSDLKKYYPSGIYSGSIFSAREGNV